MGEKEFRDKYYDQAKKQTLRTLPKFLNKMMLESFDYGSICCAVAAAALSAAWATNNHPHAGITGFQAGAVMWEFIVQWNYSNNKTGLKIVDYDNMLYRQYEEKFQKTITKSTFELLQKQAAVFLDEDIKAKAKFDGDIAQYNKNLAVFIGKHPDYPSNQKHYERLSSGTGNEWEAEEEKEKSGFEFAPRKPFYMQPCQIEHWKSIVEGFVPFGYTIERKYSIHIKKG